MNERIKQLMGQTLDEKFAGTWSVMDIVMDMQDLTKFADRFAELMVRECISQCNDGDSQYFIANHFGVDQEQQNPGIESVLWEEWVQTICGWDKIPYPSPDEWTCLRTNFYIGKAPRESVTELKQMRS